MKAESTIRRRIKNLVEDLEVNFNNLQAHKKRGSESTAKLFEYRVIALQKEIDALTWVLKNK